MANALYPKAKEQFLQGGINMSSGTIKATLVDTGTYTYSSAHQWLSDLSGIVGTPQTIGSKTFTNGTFDGSDVSFPLVAGSSAEAIVIYLDTGVAGTSPLLSYQDSGVTGLPVTPSGGNINIVWDAAGIWTI